MSLRQRIFVAILLVGGPMAPGGAPIAWGADVLGSDGPPGHAGRGAFVLNPDESLDYWDGRHAWRQLPDGRVYVWADRHWVPGGAIFWGMNDGFGPPPQQAARGLLGIPSRLNLERDDYRRRYGQDNYFRYGPGHFGNG